MKEYSSLFKHTYSNLSKKKKKQKRESIFVYIYIIWVYGQTWNLDTDPNSWINDTFPQWMKQME